MDDKTKKGDVPLYISKSGSDYGQNFVAKIPVGTSSSGKTKFRYFKTQEEYQSYVSNKNKSRDKQAESDAKELRTKMEEDKKKIESKNLLKDKKDEAKKSIMGKLCKGVSLTDDEIAVMKSLLG